MNLGVTNNLRRAEGPRHRELKNTRERERERKAKQVDARREGTSDVRLVRGIKGRKERRNSWSNFSISGSNGKRRRDLSD